MPRSEGPGNRAGSRVAPRPWDGPAVGPLSIRPVAPPYWADRALTEIDADGGAQSEHRGPSTAAMRRRRVWGSNPGATAMRRPLGRMSSRWAVGSLIDGVGSGRMVTGRKWGSAGVAGR